MDEQQRYLVTSNRIRISKDLLVEDVLSYLQSKFALTGDDAEVIQIEKTSRGRADKLIDILLLKKNNVFYSFHEALKHSEYDHLADLLLSGLRSNSVSKTNLDDVENEDLPSVQSMLRDGGVPILPDIYVKRPGCLEQLRSALFKLQDEQSWVVVHGMVGCGKTLLTAEALMDGAVLYSCFPGGIFWLSIGKVDENRLLMKMQNLYSWLDQKAEFRIPQNLDEARDRIRVLFARSYPRCLLVLDDLWSDEHARYFDVHVRTVVTTRYSAIADNLSVRAVKVEVHESLSVQQCRELLGRWTNKDPSQLPAVAEELIVECKGSPLAISMFGSLLKSHENRWNYYVQQLRDKKLSKVKSKVQYQYMSLTEAIAVSFDSLHNDLKEKYEMLAIFEEGAKIPSEVLCLLWDSDDVEVEDAMDELMRHSLIRQATSSLPGGSMAYELHDLQLDFLIEQAIAKGKLGNFHKIIVDRYQGVCQGDFSKVKPDGYFHSNIIRHMIGAGLERLGLKLLLEFAWLTCALLHAGAPSLISSFKRMSTVASSADRPSLDAMARFISVHSHIFADTTSRVDLIQLALSQPTSRTVYESAIRAARMGSDATAYYLEWVNQSQAYYDNTLLTVSLHGGSVNFCSWAPGSDVIASCGNDHLLKVWDSETGAELVSCVGHKDVVNCCEFTPDGKKLISCSVDKSLKIWEVRSGNELMSLHGHADEVTCCKCCPNGKLVLSCSVDSTLKMWDLNNGFLLATLRGHGSAVNWCCFSRDAKKIASCSNDLTLKIWSSESKQILFSCGCMQDFVSFCMFTHAGDEVVASSQHFIEIFSAANGRPLRTIVTPCTVLHAAYSPDGNHLAVAHSDMSARLLDIKNDMVLEQEFTGHQGWLTSVSFSSDGNKLVTSSSDGTSRVWRLHSQTSKEAILRMMFDVVFTGEEEPLVAAATSSNRVRLLRSAKAELVGDSEEMTDVVTSLSFSDDHSLLAVGLKHGHVKILEIPLLHPRHSLAGHSKLVSRTVFSRNGKLLLTGGDDFTCKIWDLERGSHSSLVGHRDIITECKFFAQDVRVLSSSFDGSVKIWNAHSAACILTCSHGQHAVLHFALTASEDKFLTCAADGSVKMWATASGRELFTIDDHDDAVRRVSFSPDHGVFVTGSDDGTAKVWRTDTGKLVCVCGQHGGWISSISFDESAGLIVTSSNDLKWFDLRGQLIQTFRIKGSSLRSVFSSPGGNLHVTIDNLGCLYILKKVKVFSTDMAS